MSERSLASDRLVQMRESLKRIVEPLQAEVDELDERLAKVDEERQELLAMRRELMTVIRAGDPSQRPTPKPKDGKVDANRERAEKHQREVVDKVEKFLLNGGQGSSAGLTANSINDQVQGTSVVSVRKALEELAERGVVRRDKKTKGGGMSYKLVARNGT